MPPPRFLAAIVLISALLAVACTDSIDTPRSALLERIEKANAKAEPFGNGTWQVGVDIQPGIYTAQREPDVPVGTCEGVRIGGAENGYAPLASVFADNRPAIIEISASDTRFRSTHCTEWEPFIPLVEPRDEFGTGAVLVGSDVRPGLYVSANDGTEGACYWAKQPGLGGWPADFDFWEAPNGIAPRRAVVEMFDSDGVFDSAGCFTWRRVDSISEIEPWPELAALDGFPPGLWLVAREIEPGTYAAEQDWDAAVPCSWRRLSGFDGAVDSVLEHDEMGVDDARQSLMVTIEDGDAAFATDGCTNWQRVDS